MLESLVAVAVGLEKLPGFSFHTNVPLLEYRIKAILKVYMQKSIGPTIANPKAN